MLLQAMQHGDGIKSYIIFLINTFAFQFQFQIANTKTIKYIFSYSIGSFILANVLCSKQQANRVFK